MSTTEPTTPIAPSSPPPAEPQAAPEELGYSIPDYDPADYRWVPVRRRPRTDGWTEEKQRRFIEVLADTGLVGLAAKEVGMTRTSAYRLRRAPYATDFARAWDVARERAGTLIEDIAFERAIEGVEQDHYHASGELAESRRVFNDRLLTFMLSHLKPERYSKEARAARAAWHFAQPADRAPDVVARDDAGSDSTALAPATAARPANAPASLDEALRAMEPVLPAPLETLVGGEELAVDLECADIMDGAALPHFHSEKRWPRTPEQERRAANAAQIERGAAGRREAEQGRQAQRTGICRLVHLDGSLAGRHPPPPAAGRVVMEV